MYDENLGFSTQFRPRTRFISNGGQRERILYQPMFDENGIMDLVEAGREDFYDFIQSHADSVDIHVLAVTSAVSNQLFADIYIKNRTTRPMPMYSIPGLIDHH